MKITVKYKDTEIIISENENDTEDRIKQVDKYLKNKYWEKPKKIELDLENMASGEMIGNIKGLKK